MRRGVTPTWQTFLPRPIHHIQIPILRKVSGSSYHEPICYRERKFTTGLNHTRLVTKKIMIYIVHCDILLSNQLDIETVRESQIMTVEAGDWEESHLLYRELAPEKVHLSVLVDMKYYFQFVS